MSGFDTLVYQQGLLLGSKTIRRVAGGEKQWSFSFCFTYSFHVWCNFLVISLSDFYFKKETKQFQSNSITGNQMTFKNEKLTNSLLMRYKHIKIW